MSMLSQQPLSGLNNISENADPANELRTEFYTREGLWKLVPNGEYAKQYQSMYSQQQGMQAGVTNQQMSNNCANMQVISNEAVQIVCFKYFNFDQVLSNKRLRKFRNLCVKCAQFKSSKQNSTMISQNNTTPNAKVSSRNNSRVYFGSMREYDDDDDIILASQSHNNENDLSSNDSSDDSTSDAEINIENMHISKTTPECTSKQQRLCKYCNALVSKSNDSNSLIANFNPINTIGSSPYLDLVIFNYAREIYFHEIYDTKNKITNDMKNLVDKKAYRTFMSTCFDLNINSSMLNTLDLQQSKRTIEASTSLPLPVNNNSITHINDNSLGAVPSSPTSISPSSLSLIIAAGFSKGEIHVFDGFKKEASIFYNNNRLVEKSKVTCIKWLPNSMNLFLVGHASGCIYLYDVTNQTQPTVAPIYTKLYQDESFAIQLNQHAPASSNVNIIASKIGDKSTTTNEPRSASQSSSSRKLVMSSQNQQPTAVAKNPLLKWSIGAAENSTGDGLSQFSNVNNAGINGVNEFVFSPCGSYLAIVSQDGYLRVFAFTYQNNQQLQIQLLCSMKSYFGGLLCCCWSSDGRYIATGGEDDFITVFSFVEMRVACRGRGHNSWINCCTFDAWTCSTTNSNVNKKINNLKNRKKKNKLDNQVENLKEAEENNSDLDDSNPKSPSNIETPSSDVKPAQKRSAKHYIITKKNRTISTLSDCNYSIPDPANLNGSSVFYRLASCGQDNQICFWDLTEDILKEKVTNNRSRGINVTTPRHADLPQIIIQPTELASNYEASKNTFHKSSSLVSTARNLFSLKHSDGSKSKSKSKGDPSENEEGTHRISSTSSLASGFFKKHKRNSSWNSNIPNSESSSKKNVQKNSQVVLNSYTKKSSANTISSISDTLNSSGGSTNSYNRSYTDSGVNLISKSSLDTSAGKGSTSQKNQQYSNFNICPKLDEVPMIEPLICKRISNERLTSLVFKEDGLLVATQDGYVHTWTRPVKSTIGEDL